MASNFEVALKAEAKRVVRSFHRYDTDTIARLYSRVGNPSQDALDRGVFFYTHQELPGICFRKRFDAAREHLRRQA